MPAVASSTVPNRLMPDPLMAVEVRRGEKLLLGEVASEFEKLAGDA